MTQQGTSKRRFEWELAAGLAGALIGGAAALGGSFIAGYYTQETLVEQFEQEQTTTLRQERIDAFTEFLRLGTLLDPRQVLKDAIIFGENGPTRQQRVQRGRQEILALQGYAAAYERALLYASEEQAVAIKRYNEALATVERTYITGAPLPIDAAREDLLALLREDALFQDLAG